MDAGGGGDGGGGGDAAMQHLNGSSNDTVGARARERQAGALGAPSRADGAGPQEGEEEEQRLLLRWAVLEGSGASSAPGALQQQQRWFEDAMRFLRHAAREHGEHAWCGHGRVTRVLTRSLLPWHDSQGVVRSMWRDMASEVARCPACVVELHAAIDEWRAGGPGGFLPIDIAAPLLRVVRRLNEERVEAALRAAAAVASEDELPPEAVTALFEALSFDGLLRDAGVSAAMADALCALSATHDLALGEGGRYRGLYRLMAHPATSVRAVAMPLVATLGPFEDAADFDETLAPLLCEWLPMLQGLPAADPDGGAGSGRRRGGDGAQRRRSGGGSSEQA